MLGAKRHADAHPDFDGVAVDDERRFERLLDLPDDGRDAGQVDARTDEDAELVAAEPRDRVLVAQAADEPLGHELEEFVTVLVAERVVDLLEVIEVQDEETEGLAGSLRRADRVGDAVG